MIATILDLGTNTFNILIAELDGNSYKILYKDKKNIKLGEKTIHHGHIHDEAFQRGLEGLIEYKKISDEYNSEKIYAIATSAIRSAKNGIEFVERVKALTGIEISIVDGDCEAELIQRGVKLSIPEVNDKFLIMDIGGGSTEFIISDNKTIFWKKSFDLGVARLFGHFQPSDPIMLPDIMKLTAHLEDVLKELFMMVEEHQINLMVGSSGSFDTFAQIIIHKNEEDYNIEDQRTYDFNINDFFNLHAELILKNKEERMQIKGMIAMRVDLIVLASIFVCFVLRKSNIERLKLSTYALKEGVLYSIMNNIKFIN